MAEQQPENAPKSKKPKSPNPKPRIGRAEAVLGALRSAVNDAAQSLSATLAKAADDAGSSLVGGIAQTADNVASSLQGVLAKAAGGTVPTLANHATSRGEDELLEFTPDDARSIQIFVLNTSIDDVFRLIARINSLLANGQQVRIPSRESFVDSADNVINININNFWNEFDLLNSVSDVPAPPSQDSPYELLAARLDEERRVFRQHVAAELLPALKDEMRFRPHATLEEKRELVRWTNGELRRFDFAIKHPKTGNASNFVADKGNHPEEGRFQLRSEGETRKVESFSTPHLETILEILELIAAPRREEGLGNWASRSKGSGRGTPPDR